MTRALVIKTYGDPEIAGAIVESMTKRVIPLDNEELAVVKAELARYKGRSEIRAYGDEKRRVTAFKEMARKYHVRPMGRVSAAILGAYGLVCLGIATGCEYLSAWNRR